MDVEENKKLRREINQLKSQIRLSRFKEKKRIKRRNWYLRTVGKFFVGVNLKESIKKTLEEFNESKKLSHDTIADLGSNLIKRFTRIGLLALIPIGILCVQTFLIHIQNTKITEQTDLFKTQTDLIKSQNYLVKQQVLLSEASRRSAQTFILGDVLSDMNTELENIANKKRVLSSTLTGRIISLSRVMKPYKYLVGETVINKPLSPERGQLLLSLLESEIDTAFLRIEIFKKANFQYADLEGAILRGKNLNDLDLSHSNLSNSIIENCSLFKTKFSGESDLTNAKIWFSNASKAEFFDCNCRGLSVVESSLEDSFFRGANLEGANFASGTLKNSDFRKTSLYSIRIGNFNSIPILENLRVDREDWIKYMVDSMKLKNGDNIEKIFYVQKFRDIGVEFYDVNGVKRNSAQNAPYRYVLKKRKKNNIEENDINIGYLKGT